MLHFKLEKFSPLKVENIFCSSDVTVKIYKQNSLVYLGFIDCAHKDFGESIVICLRICDDYHKRSILSIFID